MAGEPWEGRGGRACAEEGCWLGTACLERSSLSVRPSSAFVISSVSSSVLAGGTGQRRPGAAREVRLPGRQGVAGKTGISTVRWEGSVPRTVPTTPGNELPGARGCYQGSNSMRKAHRKFTGELGQRRSGAVFNQVTSRMNENKRGLEPQGQETRTKWRSGGKGSSPGKLGLEGCLGLMEKEGT